MNATHQIGLRLTRTQLRFAATSAALVVCAWTAVAQSPATKEDAPNTHNMLVFGEKTIYLSHLPMFDGVTSNKKEYTSPHRYQVILEASFRRGDQNLDNIYVDDRNSNASVRIYTLNPEIFILSRLSSDNSPSSLLTAFKAKVFRGHLERGGAVVKGLDNVDVKINRVVSFRKFDPKASKPEQLKYLLFGTPQELFLAHFITKPPDFDQVLSVKVVGHSFTEAELAKGIEVMIPDRRNRASERVKETQRVSGLTRTTGSPALKFELDADKVIYFEEGELLVPPTFDDTKLEQQVERENK